MTTRTAVLALCCGASLVTVACSQRPTQVSNSATGAYEAALAPFGEGFVVAWYDTRDGNGEIYPRMLDANGQPAVLSGVSPTVPKIPTRPASIASATCSSLPGTTRRARASRPRSWVCGRRTAPIDGCMPSTAAPAIPLFVSDGDGGVLRVDSIRRRRPRGRVRGVVGQRMDARKRAPIRLGPASKTTWNVNASIDEQGTGWVAFDAEASTRASEVYVAKVDGAERRRRQADERRWRAIEVSRSVDWRGRPRCAVVAGGARRQRRGVSVDRRG